MNPSRFSTTQGFLCREHVIQRQNKELKLDAIVRADIAKGRETIEIKAKNAVDEAVFPSGYEYITSNVDSDDVIASVQNVEKILCCSCEGLCNDVSVCACLQVHQQRNYTSQGCLIPGADKPIFECNLRCSCSIRRCTNRVVERGIKYELQIFRRRSPSVTSAASAASAASASASASAGGGSRDGAVNGNGTSSKSKLGSDPKNNRKESSSSGSKTKSSAAKGGDSAAGKEVSVAEVGSDRTTKVRTVR
jgi:hypothetical protein